MKVAIEDLGDIPGVADVALDLWPEDINLTAADVRKFFAMFDSAGVTKAVAGAALTGALAYYLVPSGGKRFSLRNMESVRAGLQSLAALVRRRRVIEELPRQPVLVPWFESHAPHGGTVGVRHEVARIRGRSYQLAIAGARASKMRQVKVTTIEEDKPLDACSTYYVDCIATPRKYDIRGVAEWHLDDIEATGESMPQTRACPYCSIDPDQIDPQACKVFQHKDFGDALAPRHTSEIVEWTKGSHVGVAVKVPSPVPKVDDITIGAEVWRSTAVTWTVSWVFQPGYQYTPYRPMSTLDLPPMWAYENMAR